MSDKKELYDNLYKGQIQGLSGAMMSGLWSLSILKENPDGTLENDFVHIESGCGVRALAAAFGAREGSGDLLRKIKGKKIFYSLDFMGLVLECFTPVSQAGRRLKNAWKEKCKQAKACPFEGVANG